MQVREEKLNQIMAWAEKKQDIRAVLLTSSLVNPLAPVDDFSDLDIELICNNNALYISDDQWINNFGVPLTMITEDESAFDGKHGMKMVLYTDGVKVDFKLYSTLKFLDELTLPQLPADWDIGYRVLIDKDGMTRHMQPPSYQTSLIKKPSAERFQQVIHEFWWDTTYVVKCLARDDLFYAKFMSEHIIRTSYLLPLIEWYIAARHDWNITTNKYGRLFKKYLSPEMWQKIERTFSGPDIADNWQALFAMADLVAELGRDLAHRTGYEYPENLETDIRKYLISIYKSHHKLS